MMGNAQEHTRKSTEQGKEGKSKSAHKDRERGKTLLTFTRKQNHCILLQNPQGARLWAQDNLFTGMNNCAFG